MIVSKYKIYLSVLLVHLFVGSLSAVTLIGDNSFGESWNTASDWEDGLPPDGTKDYVVDGANSAADFLRSPVGSAEVFGGNSLTIKDGAGIWIKASSGGTVTVDDLTFDNGKLVSAYADSTVTWYGTMTLAPGGISFSGNPGPLVVEAYLQGSGPITQDAASRETTLNSGNWAGDLNLGAGILRFGYNVTSGGRFVYTGGVFDINGRNHRFNFLSVDGLPISPGTYTADDLGSGFVGSGAIEVYESRAQKRIRRKIDLMERFVARFLRHSTDSHRVKRAVLELALERASNALDVGLEEEAKVLVRDVLFSLCNRSSVTINRNPNAATNLPVLRALAVSDLNPYLIRMYMDAADDLSLADTEWGRAVSGYSIFDGLNGDYGNRTQNELSREYFWLFAHHQSEMRYDPELLKRLLRRAHAFIDALEQDDPSLPMSSNEWYDQFTIAAGFSNIYEIRELHPGLLLPSQAARWDSVMEAMRTRFNNDYAPLGGNYNIWNYNIETARMLGALNIALYTGDAEMKQKVLDHTDDVMALMRRDGGIPYHGDGKASVNYHNELLTLWQRMYELTDYEAFEDALVATQWKGPTMGRTDEFWTSPHPKTYRWNYDNGTEAGPEVVAALSENPYVAWLNDRDRFSKILSGQNFPGVQNIGRDDVAWYRDDIPMTALPDNYTIPDRNQGGPRAWYGKYSYAGAFTPNGKTPYGRQTEGRETLMGAMTVDDDGRLNSVLTTIKPNILLRPLPLPGESEAGDLNSAWAWMTQNEKAATVISRNYSVSTSLYDIYDIRNDVYQGDYSDFNGRQMWIGMPDRIIGLVSTVPDANGTPAHEMAGVLRFISRGTAGAETLKHLVEVAPDHYRYGELDIIVHDSNYGHVRGFGPGAEVPYRRSAFPAYELTFSDRAETGGVVDQSLQSYSASDEYRFVVEVRPTWASSTEVTDVRVLGDQDLIGLEVLGATRSFQVWLNADTSSSTAFSVDYTNGLPSSNDSIVLSRGDLARPPFDSVVPTGNVTLAPGQFASVVVSADPDDHANGWESFENMVTGASSVDVTLWKDNGFGKSWETGDDWDNGSPAQPAFDYVVDGLDTSADRLRTPANAASAVFPGDSLTIQGGAEILIKSAAGGEVTIENLFFNNGDLISSYSNSTVTWKGNLTVMTGGVAFSGGLGPLVVDAEFSGSGPIRHNDADRDTTLNTGTWGGNIDLGAGTLRFGYDVTDGGDLDCSGGIFDINGRAHIFYSVTVNGSPVAPGVYTASQLGGEFTGEGTIEVLTLP